MIIIISTFITLTGLNADDLIIHTEADELIRPDLVTFLKLYDGYPVEPLAFKVKPRESRYWYCFYSNSNISIRSSVGRCTVFGCPNLKKSGRTKLRP